jgi:hypothetical protein
MDCNWDPHFFNNRVLASDYRFGLRGAGLIPYGTLPASLGALGAFKAPDQSKLLLGGAEGILLIAIVATVPVVLTFMLVRERLANWYVLSDWLWLRSSVITTGIIIASTIVCIATGILSGHYHVIGWHDWWVRPLPAMAKPFVECLLLSFAYLVGSSTLFLTVVKDDSSLPLLPKKPEVDDIISLRAQLHAIVSDPLKTAKPANTVAAAEQTNKLKANIIAALDLIEKMRLRGVNFGRRQLYDTLSDELGALGEATTAVGSLHIHWDDYWGPMKSDLGADQQERRRKIISLQGINVRA